MFRVVVGTVSLVVPITVTALDVFGYIAKVEGASMQPALNPVENGHKYEDYVLLNRWKVHNYKFSHGEIVSLSAALC